ncbi:MAG: carboxypeptidase-like regulatory domain-containing protein [Terracidiphilus sp.]
MPDAPGEVGGVLDASQDQSRQSSNKGTSAISGTVLDTNDDVIQDASVVLTSRSGGEREMQSGPNGQFAFAALPAGSYKMTVIGKDMSTFVSPWLTVNPGEMRIMSPVVLAVATAIASVTVTGNSEELKEELSEQQVQIAVEQRIWKVFPNFYSSYDWNAPPMKPKQKFQLAFRSMMDPMAFAGAAGIAGFEQYYDIFSGYGGGSAGYFKRFGAAYTNDFSARMLSSGVFATLFHQDPRYFYKGTGSLQERTMYAISSAFITRDDNGRRRPNYSHVLGVFASAGLSNLYYPKENRGLTLSLVNGAVEIAGNAGTNIVREFILKGITSHAGGKH